MSTQFIQLNQPLPAFPGPDTSLDRVTKLPATRYQLIEVRNNYQGKDDDYACIKTPEFGEVWICIRSGKTTYASIVTDQDFEAESIPDRNSDSASIDESHLINLLDSFSHFTYNFPNPYYPFNLPGTNVPQAPPAQNNCCTFVEAIVVKAWEDAVPGFNWSAAKHGQMMIMSVEDYFSPVTCLVQSNMAFPIKNADSAPHKWTVVQGWKSKWKGGHTFMILDYHKETDRVLTLESNSAFGLNGVGFRKLGNYRDVGKPAKDWWTNSNLWTWSKLKEVFKHREQCALKVKNINWV